MCKEEGRKRGKMGRGRGSADIDKLIDRYRVEKRREKER